VSPACKIDPILVEQSLISASETPPPHTFDTTTQHAFEAHASWVPSLLRNALVCYICIYHIYIYVCTQHTQQRNTLLKCAPLAFLRRNEATHKCVLCIFSYVYMYTTHTTTRHTFEARAFCVPPFRVIGRDTESKKQEWNGIFFCASSILRNPCHDVCVIGHTYRRVRHKLPCHIPQH